MPFIKHKFGFGVQAMVVKEGSQILHGFVPSMSPDL